MATIDNHKYTFDLLVETPMLEIKLGAQTYSYDLLSLYMWIADNQDGRDKQIDAATSEDDKNNAWMRYIEAFRSFFCAETGIPHTVVSIRKASDLHSYVLKCGNEYYEQKKAEEEESKKLSGESQWTVYSPGSTPESLATTPVGATNGNGPGSGPSGS
jgi:hypothetical protein